MVDLLFGSFVSNFVDSVVCNGIGYGFVDCLLWWVLVCF